MQKVGTPDKYPVPSQEPSIQSDDASAALLSQATHPAVQANSSSHLLIRAIAVAKATYHILKGTVRVAKYTIEDFKNSIWDQQDIETSYKEVTKENSVYSWITEGRIKGSNTEAAEVLKGERPGNWKVSSFETVEGSTKDQLKHSIVVMAKLNIKTAWKKLANVNGKSHSDPSVTVKEWQEFIETVFQPLEGGADDKYRQPAKKFIF